MRAVPRADNTSDLIYRQHRHIRRRRGRHSSAVGKMESPNVSLEPNCRRDGSFGHRRAANAFGRWTMSALIAASLVVVSEPARASGHVAGPPFSSGTAAAIAVPLLILPSDIGTLVDSAGMNFAMGWSLQIPISSSFRHRIAGGLDWVPGSEGHHFRGRIAYRYGLRYFFTGLGPAFDHAGTTWSPELGVKFAHAESADEQIDLSLHIVVRADIATALDRIRTVTIFFGWNVF